MVENSADKERSVNACTAMIVPMTTLVDARSYYGLRWSNRRKFNWRAAKKAHRMNYEVNARQVFSNFWSLGWNLSVWPLCPAPNRAFYTIFYILPGHSKVNLLLRWHVELSVVEIIQIKFKINLDNLEKHFKSISLKKYCVCGFIYWKYLLKNSYKWEICLEYLVGLVFYN